MLAFAKIFYLLFGLVTVASGISGYVKSNSVISAMAGGLFGVLLLAGALLLPGNIRLGLGLAGFASLALAGRFIPAVAKGILNPGAYLVPLAIVGLVVAIAGFVQATR